MRIRLHQLNPCVGDLQGNRKLIESAREKAEHDGIDLLILPEMVLTGYPPQDLLERHSFREQAYQHARQIIEGTGETALLFGTPMPNEASRGRHVFNAAVLAYQAQKVAEVHKSLLPTYDVFDDDRYFERNDQFDYVEFGGIKFGITICEDIWYNDNEIQYYTYTLSPVEELKKKGAECIINISASPFTKSKPAHRRKMLQNHAEVHQLPILYANQTGANTELIFDGDSMVLAPNGEVLARANLFEEDYFDLDFDGETRDISVRDHVPAEVPCEEELMFRALVLGVRDYVRKTGIAEKVILGLSGGIDSALTATVAREAVGAENVVGVTMPSEYSTPGSVSDSEQLARNLDIEIHEIAIKDIYNAFLNELEPHFGDLPFDIAEENVQSRTRGVLLMGMANKFRYMLLNTGNKSEMATGYCTLYGDMAGGVAVLSDVYKTEVYAIARWLNDHYYGREVIPENTITKAPSAELRPDQRDTDSLPEYEVLDRILKAYLEEQRSRDEIVEEGFEPETVDRMLKLVDYNEYKRYQAPPGLKVSAKAFGFGRRWPIVQGWTGHEEEN